MKLETLTELNAERAARRPVIVVTDTANGEQRLVKAKDIAADPLRAELAKQLRMGKSGMIEAGGKKLFLNVYAPTAKLVIVGAVHISQALAPLARSLDYDVTVVDPRTAFASPERFPDVPLIAEWPDVALPPLNIDHYTAFVAVTHDPKIDDPALLHAFERDCFYIGALGSRKTHAKRADRLKAQGASDADIARIHAPIGLAIGAVSPSEIAVSIMAEITAQLRLPKEARKSRRHEVRSRQSGRRDRRRHRAHAAPGIAGAQERHHDRPCRSRGARTRPASRKSSWCGWRRATSPKTSPPPASRRRWPATASMSSAPLPAAPICSPRRAGVLVVDRAAVDRINGVDEAITFATLAAFKPVVEGEMIATVKLIPFGVEAKLRDAAVAVAGKRRAADRALRDQARRHRLDLAAGAGAEGDRKDLARHRGAAGAGRRHHHRRAPRAA